MPSKYRFLERKRDILMIFRPIFFLSYEQQLTVPNYSTEIGSERYSFSQARTTPQFHTHMYYNDIVLLLEYYAVERRIIFVRYFVYLAHAVRTPLTALTEVHCNVWRDVIYKPHLTGHIFLFALFLAYRSWIKTRDYRLILDDIHTHTYKIQREKNIFVQIVTSTCLKDTHYRLYIITMLLGLYPCTRAIHKHIS